MTSGKTFFLALASVALAGAGYYYYTQGTADTKKTAALSNIITIEHGTIEDIVTGQGTLEPKDYVDVGAQVSGQIQKMHVEIGDSVKTGDLIAEIDPKTYETRVAGDMAQLKTLAAQKAEKEADAKLAAIKLERNKTLFADHAVSREALDETQSALEVTRAQLKSIAAQIEQAQSTLAGDRANLGYTRIYAPMDGTIVLQNIKEGQTINASQTAPVIVQIANLDIMTVRAQVAEADVMRLKVNMPVYFTTLGGQGRKWEGTIRQILPSPDTVNDVVLYNVLIDADNKDGQLMTGMTTQNFFIAGRVENVPVIPMSALGRRSAKNDTDAGMAYEVAKINGNKTDTVIVHLGMMDRKMAEIKDGLAAGDKVASPLAADVKEDAKNQGMKIGPRL